MKKALDKKRLLEIVPLSMSQIDRLEKKGEFPQRFALVSRKVVWDSDDVELWLDERKAAALPSDSTPDLSKRRWRPIKTDDTSHQPC
ncbi:MAG: AlpA family phage regulatory protein [Candidatus Symbiopectobacterium sp. Dall1.0]|nr:AlpA family phage regulatory protein [Candidatus Symbiopectobacterium sp. Dall1.0]